MNIKKRKKSRASLFSVLLSLLLGCPCAFGAEKVVNDPFPFLKDRVINKPANKAGVITWLHPDCDKGMFPGTYVGSHVFQEFAPKNGRANPPNRSRMLCCNSFCAGPLDG